MCADCRHHDAGEIPGVLVDREPLTATVVQYRDGPDRCTIAPASVTDERHFTAWLSVNADAMVPLDDSR